MTKRRWTSPSGEKKEAWEVRYQDPATNKHPSKSFALKRDAEAYKRKVEREIEDGVHIVRTSSRTVAQTIQEYVEHLQRRADEKQIGRRFANSTVRLYMNGLQMAVAYGVKRGYAARNVVPDALHELGTMPADRIETFSRVEMQKLVQTIETWPRGQSVRMQAFLRAATYLSAMCGLRRGEILALKWDAIDFEAGQIFVRHNITPDDELKGPKTRAGRRTVPMPRMVAEPPFVIRVERS